MEIIENNRTIVQKFKNLILGQVFSTIDETTKEVEKIYYMKIDLIQQDFDLENFEECSKKELEDAYNHIQKISTIKNAISLDNFHAEWFEDDTDVVVFETVKLIIDR